MTPMLTTSNPVSAHAFTKKAQRHKDGSVLLSVADDRICKLNGVGAMTWMILEENPEGLSIEEVARQLNEQFEAINSEGELRYEVSSEQLRDDTSRFLNSLAKMNLVQAVTDSRGKEFYCIKDGVSGTTSATVAAAAAAKCTSTGPSLSQAANITATQTDTAQPVGTIASVPADDDIKLSKRETFTALVGLAAFDLLLKFRGFQSLIKRVEEWPTAEPRTTDREVCRRVRAMVDRAQMYYPKKAMCLQHSAVVTCLLRRRGVPAEMVLAAQEFPPKGHAWAEVAGEVINDQGSVKNNYLVLRRV